MICIQVTDRIRKEQQAIRSKINVLEDELNVVYAEIASIQEDLDAATGRKDKAYESLAALRQARDAKVSLHILKAPHEKMPAHNVVFLCYARANTLILLHTTSLLNSTKLAKSSPCYF
jgi:hypothetical protein